MRLGVALLAPPPFDTEVDAFRRALEDGSRGRIPPHLTLVPPVNVAADRLSDVLAVLRVAGWVAAPFRAVFGPPATFLPDNPVLYLPVVEGVEEVRALRDRVFVEPLDRPLTWPFVPHVTLADGASPERIAAARIALAGYRATVDFDRVHLLRQRDDRVWSPIAEVPLGPPMVRGRGGLPVELSLTARADPEAAALLAEGASRQSVVTARRDGAVAGVVVLALGEGEEALGTGDHLQDALRRSASPED